MERDGIDQEEYMHAMRVLDDGSGPNKPDPEEKRFSIWVQLKFEPTNAERRKAMRVLRRARNELCERLGTSGTADKRDGKHEISAQG